MTNVKTFSASWQINFDWLYIKAKVVWRKENSKYNSIQILLQSFVNYEFSFRKTIPNWITERKRQQTIVLKITSLTGQHKRIIDFDPRVSKGWFSITGQQRDKTRGTYKFTKQENGPPVVWQREMQAHFHDALQLLTANTKDPWYLNSFISLHTREWVKLEVYAIKQQVKLLLLPILKILLIENNFIHFGPQLIFILKCVWSKKKLIATKFVN